MKLNLNKFGKMFPFKKRKKSQKYFDNSLQNIAEKQEILFENRKSSFEDNNSIDNNLVALLKPHSFESEQFKMLRTKLLFPGSGNAPRSIMVTSAALKEGKSFTAANLAISIAQTTDRYVLLVDSDLRTPCIHTLFGFGEVRGLSEYLSGEVALSSLLLRTKVNGLTILPGGAPPHNPSELLSSEKMTELLGEVKDKYSDRYVVIDSPPPLIMAGTTVIARQVEGIVVVVKYGSTPVDLLTELIDTVEKEKILGIIINESTYYGHGRRGKYGKLYSGSLKNRFS
ncbi:MAG: CpsD/CapB family tyrosine-protein kinase [Desulfobacteraceae bacterium]|nr:CpsD/CapB family tyrosine-protein kinase [Desulfobacteraceae bacterium]